MSRPTDELRIVVAIPSGDTWKSLFGMSLGMLMMSFANYIPPYKTNHVTLRNRRGSILPQSRQALAESAVEGEASHILFIDDDMVFPPDTAKRLLSHRKWVVGCNCPTKMIPATTTARQKSEKSSGNQVFSTPDKHGLEKVWRVGTGVLLIDTRVFEKLEKPWFPMRWVPELQNWQGEDWGFCEKLEEAGFPIFVDHDLSREIGHTGEFTYTHDVVGSVVQVPVVPAAQPQKLRVL